MARPTGWDILGLGGDPTPGVVESVRALAKQFHDFADDAERAWRDLNSFGGDSSALEWVGQTADAFKSNFGPLPGRMQKLYTSYREAGDALTAYAPKLQAAQSKADTALRQAQDANVAVQRASTAANTAQDDLKTAQQNHATNPDPQTVTDAQTAHDTAQTNLNNAKAHLASLATQANQAHDERIAAAKACADAIGKAQSDGIHNKPWWEHVGEALSEWGGKIAEIAGELAPILDLIALATSWIPGLDVITAALAELDNIVALAGTLMSVAGDAMQGHWGDALLGAGMLALTFVGARALGSEAEAAEGEAGALEGEEGAAARQAEGSQDASVADDPVDVVSGWMLTSATDVELPGVLPMVLRRAYASGYATGRLFGPGWSSTVDQRLSINESGIHFVGDDAQRLDYPMPADGPVLPVRGARWPLVWDRDSDEIQISDPWSGRTHHFAVVHFSNELGQIRDLTAITDRNGNRISILRDEQGTPTLVEHPGYRIAVDTVATAAGPRISGLRLLGGADSGSDITLSRFSYDERGRLTGVINSSGLPFTYEWDEADRIRAWRDRNGYRYGYVYDERGRVVRGEGEFLAGSFRYDTANRTTVHTNSLGEVTTYVYDEYGHVCAETDALGAVVVTVSDMYGRVLSRTDALGGVTMFDRDESGDVRRVVAADGSVTELAYNGLHRVVTAVGPDGATWHREHDERGNLTAVTDAAGAVTRFEYAPGGALAAAVDPVGTAVRFGTNAAGLTLSLVDALGGVTRAERDVAGRVVGLTDPLGATTALTWNTDGQPLTRTGPDGAVTRWEYDANGRLLKVVNPVGAATVYEPGPMGTLIARTGPDGVRHVFDYDSELRLRSVTNPAGASWTYTYDAAGRLAGETDFIGRTLGYEWDVAGRLAARVTGTGQRITLEWDAAGRVASRHTPEGEYQYSYDSVGRLLSATGPDTAALAFEYDVMGRMLSESVDGRATRYTYDALGRRVRRVTASGIESTWTFDAAGRPLGLDAGLGRMEFAHDAAGQETQRLFGADAWLSRDYDAAGRLVAQRLTAGVLPEGEQSAAAGAGAGRDTVLSRSWLWRADGVPEEIRDSLRGTRRFVSDTAGRVTAVTAQEWSEAFAYDAFGNPTATGTGGTGGGTGGAASAAPEPTVTSGTLVRQAGRTHNDYDDAGRLVRSVRRTLDGRRKTWTYTWDSQDRLVQVETPENGTWRYTYDPSGRRTAKHRLADDGRIAEQTLFTWEDSRLAEQSTARPDGTTVTLTWDYDPDTHRPAAQRRRSWADEAGQGAIDEAFHAVVTDLVGAPAELVTPDGHIAWRTTSSLWGRTIGTSADEGLDCPLRFPGQYHDDESGLHYNLHRYYDPDTAAYLTPDPLGLVASPNDHSYVPNPLTFADPLGLYEKQVTQQAIDHVVNGEVKDGKFGGWHMHPDQTGGIPEDRFIKGDLVKNADGSWKAPGGVGARFPDAPDLAKVSIDHNFFPESWDKDEIIAAGNHLLNNGAVKKNGAALSGTWKGVKIYGFTEKTADGSRTLSSWFPSS
jgi:RHS repeat-associated protein